MKAIKTRRYIFISAIILTGALVFLIIWGNTAISLSEITVENERLPLSFDGYTIAHVSDLHDAEIGKDNESLIKLLKDASPDIIAITGDLVDCNRVDIEHSLDFMKEALKIAPCYYVSGNHEAWLTDENYQILESSLLSLGVTILHGEEAFIEKDGDKISISGISDPDFAMKNNKSSLSHMSVDNLKSITDFDGFKIFLSHRPEYFDNYVDAGYELVLSGHAHGGQVRIPFLGGVAAPNQGLFPEYDSGLYSKSDTNMIVSRGIGNSIIPIRINNRPEVILITLKR